MIQLQHIVKTFKSKHGDIQAVKDVTLTIEKQDIFGIIGYSGAGKSTLIRCINLLERPDAGEVFIDNKDLMKLNDKQLREERKNIGMIFQHFNLMRSRSVYENVAFPLKDSTLSKEEKDKKIKDLLELVELQDKKNAYPAQLSGGQKQRVAIARALANDPSVLLCDEATSALDPQTTRSILNLLKEVNQRLNITIVLITHEMAVVKEICNRVAIMDGGVVVESGRIEAIFAHPKAEITKQFLQTTSSLTRIYELIEANSDITKINNGQSLVHLKYDAQNTQEAMLSHVSRELGVDISIIFGNVEVIQDTPLGDMVVILSGNPSQIASAIAYFQQHHVEVEVMKSC